MVKKKERKKGFLEKKKKRETARGSFYGFRGEAKVMVFPHGRREGNVIKLYNSGREKGRGRLKVVGGVVGGGGSDMNPN